MNSTNAPQMIEYVNLALEFTPQDTKFIPGTAKIVCCGISPKSHGALKLVQLEREGGAKEVFSDLSFGSHGIKCATFGASRLLSNQVAIGDYGGSLSICDLERATGSADSKDRKEECSAFSAQGHTGIINAIDGVGGTTFGAPEIATGGKDGCVKIWDPRVKHAVVTLEPTSNSRDCWSVAFGNSYNNDERSVLAGFDNGDVKLFDLRTNTMRWEANCKNGVTCAEFDRPDIEMNKITVTTLESKFHVYDLRTKHPTDGFASMSVVAHRSTIWISKHLPQNRDLFMTGGGNGGFNIYKYIYPKNRVGKHRDTTCLLVFLAKSSCSTLASSLPSQ